MAFASPTPPCLSRTSQSVRDALSCRPRSHPLPARRHCSRPIYTPLASADASPTTDLPAPLPLIGTCGRVAPEVGNSVVGVFAILDASGQVRHISISRDVATSLRRALARVPTRAHFYRVQRFTQPSRTVLEATRADWAARASESLDDPTPWERPVDVTNASETRLSPATRERVAEAEGAERPKALRVACRELQAAIDDVLRERGLTEKLKFAGLLKPRGLLDVDSVKIAVPESI